MRTTMVITTRNRARLLEVALTRLLSLTPPTQLLVIDDGGSDRTEAVVHRFGKEVRKCEVAYYYNDNPGQTLCSLARNVGIRQARHVEIITVEPEVVFLTDVVAQLADLRRKFPTHVISSGRIYFQAAGRDLQGDARILTKDSDQKRAQLVEGWSTADRWVAPHIALWNREWLYEVGGWDEHFPGAWGWDDTDLLTRLRIKGHNQHISSRVRAVHLWHPLGEDKGGENERYFMGKSFHRDPEDLTDVVANKGEEWGSLRLRGT